MTTKGHKLGRKQHMHGLTGIPEFDVLRVMIRRCKADPHYAGLSVHQPWIDDPRLFVLHVGHRPSPKHEIDRIDNSKGYEPGNVRWSTSKDQKLNRGNTIWLEAHGKKMCLMDWARELKLDPKTIRHRLYVLKQSPEEALTPGKRPSGWKAREQRAQMEV